MSSNSSSCDRTEWTLKILNNRYIIIKKLGKGAYASVWIAYDVNIAKYCAIKIGNIEDYRICFNEATKYKQINKYQCPYLIEMFACFDYKTEYGTHYCIVFDLLGSSLYDYIKKNKNIKPQMLSDIIKQVLEAIRTLHEHGHIHGDIKPENILLTEYTEQIKNLIFKLNIRQIIETNVLPNSKKRKNILNKIKSILELTENDETNTEVVSSFSSSSRHTLNSDGETIQDHWTVCSDLSENSLDNDNSNTASEKQDKLTKHINVKLIDFGGTININDEHKKKQIQTCYYMSPEILLRIPYDTSADIWALGCTIYELLLGQILFDPDNYNGNEDRYHLYMIEEMLGQIPENMIKCSEYKDIFFSRNFKKIKGFNEYTSKNLFDKLSLTQLDSNCTYIKKICDLVCLCLKIHPCDRISIANAINLFTQ